MHSTEPVMQFCGDCGANLTPRREFTWLRQVQGIPAARDVTAGRKPVVDASAAWELVRDPATWDNGGRHVVMETIAGGLEYAVYDTDAPPGAGLVKRVLLDLDEAIQWAMDLNHAATQTQASR